MVSIEKIRGCLAIAVFSLAYYWATIYLVVLAYRLWFYPLHWFTILILIPILISALLPPMQLPHVVGSKFLKSMLSYFDFQDVSETTDEEMKTYMEKRNVILACHPHGVMSVVGSCWGSKLAPQFPIPPTAVANVILRFPLLKHVIGIYGVCSAEGPNLSKTLKTSSVVLYVGGISEMFLSKPTEERLFIKDRKGFIKLALRAGADVVPVYMFGNTIALEIVQNKFLRNLSRKLGVSLTVMWGLWGLPIPLPCKLLLARGAPIGLPKIENPSQADIDEWHAKYMEAVRSLFDKYKGLHPAYRSKTLYMD